MADFWMDVDAALSEVPVNIMALVDDTDFKTREESITYDQSGMDLVWNFVTTAGAMTQTAVAPTTGGDYDWANQGNGMYSIEIPASGGASINNDTEGFGWFTGFATGVLPWRGPTIGFRAVALNNALIDGGDILDVNITELGGTAQSATDLKDFADVGYDPVTNKIEGVKLVDANTDMVGTNNAALASVLGAAVGASISADIANLPTVAEFEARTLVAADYVVVWDTIAGVTLVTTCTTNSDMVGTNNAALASVCTEARLAELDEANLPTDIADIPTVADILAGVIEGTITFQQACRIYLSALTGISTNNGTRMRDVANSKNRINVTVDANNNRLTSTVDGT